MNSELVTSLLNWVAANPGWISAFIFISALGESLTIIGVIIPGALLMFSLGALIGLGHIDFWSAYWWSTLGAIIGDALSFWIGEVFQDRIRRLWPFTKHPEMITRSEEFFRKHGGKSVLFGRFFGPVRGTIPTVAGMMGMHWRAFTIANVISGVLWAPVYLLPGMVFGASLDIASRVAGRLAILLLISVALLWITVWVVKHAVRIFEKHATDWLQRFTAWSAGRPWIGSISASVLDPRENELRGLMALALLLLGSFVLFSLSMSAAGQQLPSALDASLYNFFQDLRSAWADALLVFITEIGNYQVLLPLSSVVLLWLIVQRYYSAAWHWLAALGFGMATNLLFRWLLPVTSPVMLLESANNYSFPSTHATFSTLVFGFLAVLIARELAPAQRWWAYIVAALLIVPISFARLYLGIHWLSDTLAGLCLGVIWVAILGIAYNRRPRPSLPWRPLLTYSVLALVLGGALHSSHAYRDDIQRYQPRFEEHFQSRQQWLTHGWQQLPLQRLGFRGRQLQDLSLQWAGSAAELVQRLQTAGWQIAPPLDIKGLLLALSPEVALHELPVLPQLHNGREDDITLVRYDADPSQRWLLRFWDTGARLQEGQLPIWVGSISRQQRQPRLRLFTLAVDQPAPSSAIEEMLQAAWSGLTVQPVAITNTTRHIILITDQ